MSRPRRLPEEVYDAVISEVAADLRDHLPKWIPAMTRSRLLLQMVLGETEAQKASLEPEVPWREIQEEFCRKLIARAEGSDKRAKKQAKADLRAKKQAKADLQAKKQAKADLQAKKKQAKADLQVLAILFLEDVIAGSDDAAAPGVLLRCVRDILERSLPYDADLMRERHVQIATAVDRVLETVPGIRATRNEANCTAEHPESACSLVAKALTNVGRDMTEINVQKIWETWGVWRAPTL